MTSKRPSEGSPDGTPAKLTKSENGDFSRSVRKKLTTTSRTGQACDRCKVRLDHHHRHRRRGVLMVCQGQKDTM